MLIKYWQTYLSFTITKRLQKNKGDQWSPLFYLLNLQAILILHTVS
jgi:hypothetical protein